MHIENLALNDCHELDYSSSALLHLVPEQVMNDRDSNGGVSMLQQIWDSFIMLIPVFFLLTMIFGAGFYIGRVSKRDN